MPKEGLPKDSLTSATQEDTSVSRAPDANVTFVIKPTQGYRSNEQKRLEVQQLLKDYSNEYWNAV